MSVAHTVDARRICDDVTVRSRDVDHAVAGFEADGKLGNRNVLTATTHIPDHDTAIATRGSDNAVVTRLETNLLDGRRVGAHDVSCLLSVHIYDAGSLISRTGSKRVIVRGEGHVHDGVAVRFEANVVLGEGVVREGRVYEPHTTLLIADSDEGVCVAASDTERQSITAVAVAVVRTGVKVSGLGTPVRDAVIIDSATANGPRATKASLQDATVRSSVL